MRGRYVYLGSLAGDSVEPAFDPLPKRRPKIVFEDSSDSDSDDRKGILLRLRIDTSPAAKDTADKAIETARVAAESFRWAPIFAAGAAGVLIGVLLSIAWNRAVSSTAKRRAE